ncbi:hypothetical protein GLOTRDRAFT_122612 [Gloeophyllum trabeum ATCC 11539]|uniref:Uncharacterized protein n=1 Tax=Gloeophyllum trabeum (strain ATCC 11539 / FP-39264 / Madison 617) TaxID=670483 RepID=S7PYS8_GLOTA|nr:uncharacterized protein GLOTRDRAFT_122612 [Gloeophyllum trabeum ATCC 11539]EPQ52613.1 hypothetical protein GLOTRDRAFT_122612 [Gloeophyllum trabeum ATCC 11539]
MGPFQKFQFLVLWISSLLYGAVCLLLSRTRERCARVFLLTAIILLWVAITGQTIIFLLDDFLAFEIQAAGTSETEEGLRVTNIANILTIVGDAFSVTSFVVADSILLWRCFLLYNRSWRVVLFPGAMLLAVFGSGVTIMGIDIKLYLIRAAASADVTGPPAIWMRLSDVQTYLNIVYYAASVSTNLYATGFIAFRIWRVTREVRDIVGNSHGKRFISAALLIAESGFIYSAALLLAIIVQPMFNSLPNLTRIVGVVVFYASGIVPTLLVALIGIRKTIAPTKPSVPTLLTIPATLMKEHEEDPTALPAEIRGTWTPEENDSASSWLRRDGSNTALQESLAVYVSASRKLDPVRVNFHGGPQRRWSAHY